MELILFVLFLTFIAVVSYAYDYTYELSLFQKMDEIERVLG